MKARFADTFYYLAVLNPNDAAHRRAVELRRSAGGPTVTTAWVLTEAANSLAGPGLRGLFLRLFDQLEADQSVTVVPAAEALFDRGVAFYRSRPDKEWSLTDCISFVVMKERGIDEALTEDHHFEQAGFKALLA